MFVDQITGKWQVEDPRKNRGSKTHGRSILKKAAMGFGAGEDLEPVFFMGLGTDIFMGLGTDNVYESWN